MYNSKSVSKIVVFCSIIFGIIYCNDDKSTQPENDSSVVGHWKVSSMSWDGPAETGSYTQEQLDSIGLIWNINLNSDMSVEQITNLSGPITTQLGTWETNGDNLILRLQAPSSDEIGTMEYQYSVENNILKLDWTIAAGTKNNSAAFTKE